MKRISLIIIGCVMMLCGFTFNIVYAASSSITVITIGADKVTYYGALLKGYISDPLNEVGEYGFEVWNDESKKSYIVVGNMSMTGDYSTDKMLLASETEYYYRTYSRTKNGVYSYGDIMSFYTLKEDKNEHINVNLNINVTDPESINSDEEPNRIILNSLIKNRPDDLKLIAGNDFSGVNMDISTAGDDPVFINEYYMQNYENDLLLKSLLTAFDLFVYNRDQTVWNAITFILPKDIIYAVTPDSANQMLDQIFNDMSRKRYQGAINNSLTGEYTSDDKRTFGYDQVKYQQLNSFADSLKAAKKAVSEYKSGVQKVDEGVEAYQKYYMENIMPKYENAQNNLLQINKYLLGDSGKLSSEKKAENLGYMTEYIKEISAYETLDFADAKAKEWKAAIDNVYFSDDMQQALKETGYVLNITSSTINTWKTAKQLEKNEEQLKNVFNRISENTDDESLKSVMDDYVAKMENNKASFLFDSIGNIYNTFLRNRVEKAVNAEIQKAAVSVITANTNAYTSFVINKAIGKANYVLLAADAGGFFSEVISGTKTILEKTIEVKYLYSVENEAKKVLQNDLIVYQGNETDELAKNIIDDLYFIKSLKLREMYLVKEIYVANGSNWVSKGVKKLSVIADGVDIIYKSQLNALLSASITEAGYTYEPLVLEKGEEYYLHNKNGSYNGIITKNNEKKLLQNAEKRLVGDITIKNGGRLVINYTDQPIYISSITIENGGSLEVSDSNITIGELTNNNGEKILLSGNITINNNLFSSGNIILGNGNLTVMGNTSLSGGIFDVGDGELYVGGSVFLTGGTLDIDSGKTVVNKNIESILGVLNVNNGKIEVLGDYLSNFNGYTSSYSELIMNGEKGHFIVGGTFHTSAQVVSDGKLTNGILELKGDFIQEGDEIFVFPKYNNFTPSDNHQVIISGTSAQHIKFRNPDYSWFGKLSILNDNVYFDTPVNIKEQTSNYNLKGTVKMQYDFTIPQGYSFNVDGDMNISKGSFNIGNNSLNITGNLILSGGEFNTVSGTQTKTGGILNVETGDVNVKGNIDNISGTLNISNGNVNIDGDYLGNSTTGIYGCDGSYGILKMNGEKGYMTINGSLYIQSQKHSVGYLTNGTIELKGDFIQNTKWNNFYNWYDNFAATGNHTIILSGENKQNISFTKPNDSYFNNLIIKNSSENGIEFETNITVNGYIRQPVESNILNRDNVILKNKNAFVDYGNINSKINQYVGNHINVIPTWLDYDEYLYNEIIITVPVANENLIYTGEEQQLINSGSVKKGIMQYSTDGITYSEKIPVGINAKTYTIWYIVKVDDESTTEPRSINAKILRGNPEITAPKPKHLKFTGEEQELITAGYATLGAKLLYSIDGKKYYETIPTGISPGDYKVWYKAKSTSNTYEISPQYVEASILDILPSASFVKKADSVSTPFPFDQSHITDNGEYIEKPESIGTSDTISTGFYKEVQSEEDKVYLLWDIVIPANADNYLKTFDRETGKIKLNNEPVIIDTDGNIYTDNMSEDCILKLKFSVDNINNTENKLFGVIIKNLYSADAYAAVKSVTEDEFIAATDYEDITVKSVNTVSTMKNITIQEVVEK